MNKRLYNTALLLGMQLLNTATNATDAVFTAFKSDDPHSPESEQDDPDIAAGGFSETGVHEQDVQQVRGGGFTEPNYIFTSLASGSGDLSSWLGAGSGSQIETTKAADRICRAEAQRAQLPNADEYIAWLSDENDDAYCRAHGLKGTVAEQCGQDVLPDNAGPWVRLDGKSFGGKLTDLLAPSRPIRSVQFAPFSTTGFVNRFTAAFTGTDASGIGVPGLNCNNWEDSQAEAVLGSLNIATNEWSGTGVGSCDSNSTTLMCLRPGEFSGGTFPTELPIARKVFVTTESGPGDLSQWPDAVGMTGIDAGDEICRAHASRAGLEQSDHYRAWLSDDEITIINAIDRFEYDGILLSTDGYTVTRSLQSLVTSGVPNIRVNLNEFGVAFPNQQTGVWTGTVSDGTARSGSTCDGWTDDQARGIRGIVGSIRSTWTASILEGPCDVSAHLYCFADFADEVPLASGFERIEPFNPE